MQITIDGHEFQLEARRVEEDIRFVGGTIKDGVRKWSLQAKRMIQIRMPVDTGRARASWGNEAPPPPAEPGDGIWEEKDGGMTITQGSNVEYIEYLNDGWSSQAPAGFIDAEEEAAASGFEQELGEILLTNWGF